jgi:hypothetical protein
MCVRVSPHRSQRRTKIVSGKNSYMRSYENSRGRLRLVVGALSVSSAKLTSACDSRCVKLRSFSGDPA